MKGFLKSISKIFGGGPDLGNRKSADRVAQNTEDKANFEKFRSQDLLDPDTDLFVPTYKRNKHMADAQEGMLSLFNARKDQILAARRTPGINQTRF